MPKKPKQIFRDRKELVAELKNNVEFQAKLKFTKEIFWPAMCGASENIDDAIMLLSGWNTVIMQSFLELMKDHKLSELNLKDKLDVTSPNYNKYVELLNLFNNMSIFDARDHVEGMRNEVNLFLTEENKERKLSDLKPRWIDEIK